MSASRGGKSRKWCVNEHREKNLHHFQEKKKREKVDPVLCFTFKIIGRPSEQHQVRVLCYQENSGREKT